MTVTHDQIVRLFPGIQDHSVLEIIATKATVEELEAAMLLLNDEDEGLIALTHRDGDQMIRLLDILSHSEIPLRENRDQ